MRQRAPLPTHELVIEHERIQYLRVQVDAKTRQQAVASVEEACRAMLTRPQYLALAYQAQWEVHTNQMRLVDGARSMPPSPTDPAGMEARLLQALAQLTMAHADTGAVTDHARHGGDPIDTCVICAALDTIFTGGQQELERRRQAYDDLQQHCDALQARYATLQAAHTRLEEEYAMLTERHEGLSTAYYTVALAQHDADRDPSP